MFYVKWIFEFTTSQGFRRHEGNHPWLAGCEVQILLQFRLAEIPNHYGCYCCANASCSHPPEVGLVLLTGTGRVFDWMATFSSSSSMFYIDPAGCACALAATQNTWATV